jgi:hypothetical protein
VTAKIRALDLTFKNTAKLSNQSTRSSYLGILMHWLTHIGTMHEGEDLPSRTCWRGSMVLFSSPITTGSF